MENDLKDTLGRRVVDIFSSIIYNLLYFILRKLRKTVRAEVKQGLTRNDGNNKAMLCKGNDSGEKPLRIP